MATDWGAIEAGFMKLQPKIKAIDPAPVEKLIKQIKATLKTLWAGEDVFAKAIKTAGEGGIKGSKLADFAGDKAVMAALKVLRKAGSVHEALVEQKERDKNAKQAVKLAKTVAKLCDGAVKKADPDPKAAAPYLKKAAELIKELKDLNTAYQTLKKKNAKLIKASKDKSKIVRVIAAIAKAHDLSASRYSETLAKVKEHAP